MKIIQLKKYLENKLKECKKAREEAEKGIHDCAIMLNEIEALEKCRKKT